MFYSLLVPTEQVTIIPKVPVNENKEVKFREEGGRQKG